MTEHQQHIVHWYQAEMDVVDSWEFQYLPGGTDSWQWATAVGPVQVCLDCFEVPLDLPGGVAAVRARAIGPDGASAWGSPVGLPEPPYFVSVLVALLLVAVVKLIANKRKVPR